MKSFWNTLISIFSGIGSGVSAVKVGESFNIYYLVFLVLFVGILVGNLFLNFKSKKGE